APIGGVKFDVHSLQTVVVGNMLTNESRILSQGHAKLKNHLVSLKIKKSLLKNKMSKLEDILAKAQRNQDVEGSQVDFKDLQDYHPEAEKLFDEIAEAFYKLEFPYISLLSGKAGQTLEELSATVTYSIFISLAMLSSAMPASYSASLLVIVNSNFNAYVNYVPSGLTIIKPAPEPSPLNAPGKVGSSYSQCSRDSCHVRVLPSKYVDIIFEQVDQFLFGLHGELFSMVTVCSGYLELNVSLVLDTILGGFRKVFTTFSEARISLGVSERFCSIHGLDVTSRPSEAVSSACRQEYTLSISPS
nr:hypothetical protein [Tanacetum cinerariifolium]